MDRQNFYDDAWKHKNVHELAQNLLNQTNYWRR